MRRLLRNRTGFSRGATQLGFMDVLTALIMLGILAWAASRQFSTYAVAPAAPKSAATAKP